MKSRISKGATPPALALVLVAALLSSPLAKGAENALSVTVQTYKDLVIYPERTAAATVVANNHATIPAEIAAIVEVVSVDLGDALKQGEIIAKLDCTDYELAAKQARLAEDEIQVQQQFEKRQLERARQLELNKSIGQAEVDRIETAIASLTAKLKLQQVAIAKAERMTSQCQITAPYDGVVTQKFVNEGERVNVGQPVIKLLQQSDAKLIANIPLSEIKNIDAKAQYEFQSDEQHFPVKLRSIVPYVNAGSRNQTVEFSIASDDVIIGREGRLVWKLPQPYMPSDLLLKRHGSYGTFIHVNGKAKFVKAINAQEGRPFAMSLDENAQVILDGRHQLDDGVTVSVTVNGNGN